MSVVVRRLIFRLVGPEDAGRFLARRSLYGGVERWILFRTMQLAALAFNIGALFTFIAYKLGDRIGTIGELMRCFTLRGHWYLIPLLSVLLTVGSLLVVAASSPLVAPFIYTLF